MLNLDNISLNTIISGENIGNTLTINSSNVINKGNIGYKNLIVNPFATLTTLNGINPISTIDYNTCITSINQLISNIGNLTYTTFDVTDIGSISSILTPLPPGNYLFNNPVTFNTTLYLSGKGQYVFYCMSTLSINTLSVEYINMTSDVIIDDIFFYSVDNIIFNTSNINATIYGNFISDLDIIDISTGNFNIYGRFLSTTGSITLTNTQFMTMTIACFLKGTHIMTETGEVLIENLMSGYLIKVSDGRLVKILENYKTMFRINKENHDILPIKIKCDYFNIFQPNRDTYISHFHYIKINDKWIYPDKITELKCEYLEIVEYYNLRLPNYYTDFIIANGLICDSLHKFDEILV
jgi:hypothetical protein